MHRSAQARQHADWGLGQLHFPGFVERVAAQLGSYPDVAQRARLAAQAKRAADAPRDH